MNHPRLFWHLVRFHFQILHWVMLPMLILMFLVISFCTGISGFLANGISMGSYRNFDQIFPFIYIFILAAQITWGMQSGKSSLQNQNWSTGNYAFLFTRAIHRPTLYWAKLAVFSLVCLIPIFPTLFETIRHPDIRIQLYQKAEMRDPKLSLYQSNYPAMTVVVPEKNPKDQIVTLPGASWDQFSVKSAKIILISLTILWLCSLSRRWPRIWLVALGVFLLAILGPLLLALTRKAPGAEAIWDSYWDDETFLFLAHNHQLAIWLSLSLLGLFIIWDTRRRFLQITQFKTVLN